MSAVYANILETLTSGLYNDVNFAIREYLQNSYDAIKEAKNCGLQEPEDGYHVSVQITKNNKTITISDNGIGMDNHILSQYTSIGGGTKNSSDFAGHKGIGKLSGLRFFNNFVVRTKKINENAYELRWNSGEMMKMLMSKRELMKKTPYSDFIKDYVEIKEIKEIKDEDKNKHYTQVQLINVIDDVAESVSEGKIINFIKENCPVEFFKEEFSYADKITEWIGGAVPYVETLVNDDKVITQHHNDEYNLVEPIFREIKYSDHLRAKVWFSWKKDTSEIISHEQIRGIKFRCKGICVGDNRLFTNHCMPGGSEPFANWFTGEVIVLDDTIIPSAARDRFYEGKESKKLYEELKKQVGKELRKIADIRSRIHSSEQDLASFNKAESEGKETTSILKKISKKIKELRRGIDVTANKYDLDFGIIEKLEAAVETGEKNVLEKIPEKEKQINKLIEDNDKKALIDTILNLQKDETKAHTKKAKEASQGLINTVKVALTSDSNGKEEKHIDSDSQEQLYLIVRILIKYLEENKVHFDESTIEPFVINELGNEQ
jgi:hypothetical protein